MWDLGIISGRICIPFSNNQDCLYDCGHKAVKLMDTLH